MWRRRFRSASRTSMSSSRYDRSGRPRQFSCRDALKTFALAALLAWTVCRAAAAAPNWCPGGTGDHGDDIPRYDHIFVIIAENHAYGQIIGNPKAPNLNRLARPYGSGTQFYGEVHPSKANYVAILGGDTFGIHDDDAFYCRAGSGDRYCGYADKITP